MTKKEIKRIGKSRNISYTEIEDMICEIFQVAECDEVSIYAIIEDPISQSNLFTGFENVNNIKTKIIPEEGSVFKKMGNKVLFYENEEVDSKVYEIEQDWLTVIAFLVLYDYFFSW